MASELKRVFKWERDTKGTRVYTYTNGTGRKESIYLLKPDAADLGNPDAVEETIRPITTS